MDKCKRCDTQFPFAVQHTERMLVGHFVADICGDCLNDWTLYAKETPEFAELTSLEALENFYKINQEITLEQSQQFVESKVVVEKKFFNMATEWMKIKITQRVYS